MVSLRQRSPRGEKVQAVLPAIVLTLDLCIGARDPLRCQVGEGNHSLCGVQGQCQPGFGEHLPYPTGVATLQKTERTQVHGKREAHL